MGHVYRERCEIRRPDSSYLNHCDGRVYVINNGNENDRTTIGWATSDEFFHPNDNFRLLFPSEWEKAFSKYKERKVYEYRIGMYGLCLGIGYKTGLYPALVEAYDGLHADDIMDYAMYSILQRNDVTQLYPERMREEVLFSGTVRSDSYWSDLFKTGLKDWQHNSFRELWLKTCISRGTKSVWICIDGSNGDNQMKDSEYSEYGEGKSHSGKPIIGYSYAVDAETGEPITYFTYPGSKVDSQAFHKMINYLVGYGLKVDGVILDRGYCTYEVLQTLKTLSLRYVIMVPSGTTGHKTMVKELGQEIFWKSKHLVNERGVFGISKEEVIWKAHPDEKGILNLFFGAVRGCFEGVDLLAEVLKEKQRAEDMCKKGKKPTISRDFKDIILVHEDETGYYIDCDYNAWDAALRGKGFFTILSSDDFGPKFAYNTYQKRIKSEVQYRSMKSQEGYDTTRTHTDEGMLSKYAICFAENILRYWIMKACQKHDLDTNEMIQKMDWIRLLVNDGGKLIFIRDVGSKSLKLLQEFSMNKDSFEGIAAELNERSQTKIKSEVRVLPDTKPEGSEKPRRGRPLGSKNKKTLEREAALAKQQEKGETTEEPKRKRGRPAGAKDSKPRKKRKDVGVRRGPRKKAT